MKPSVYIETTIPSFYHEVRMEPEMLARCDWTREWGDNHRSRYDVVTSEAVIEELEIGTFPSKDNTLALIEPSPLLAINEAIADAVAVYLGFLVPIIVTWNFSGRLQRYERRSNDCRYMGSTAQNIYFHEPRSTKTGGTLPRAARTASGALGVTPNPSSGTPRRERCLTRACLAEYDFLRSNPCTVQVSVQEIQRDLSAYLQRVEAGET
jgi:hypothetical protein